MKELHILNKLKECDCNNNEEDIKRGLLEWKLGVKVLSIKVLSIKVGFSQRICKTSLILRSYKLLKRDQLFWNSLWTDDQKDKLPNRVNVYKCERPYLFFKNVLLLVCWIVGLSSRYNKHDSLHMKICKCVVFFLKILYKSAFA